MSAIIDRKTTGLDCSFCTPFRGESSSELSALALWHQQFQSSEVLATAAAPVQDGPTPKSAAETAVARFYKTITARATQGSCCFPFDDPLRKRVGNNWAIVKPTISDMTPEQQSLCREIMKNLCSEDGYERFMKQMDDDAGGFETYHVAVFGEPGTDKPFEWVLTGRHDTSAPMATASKAPRSAGRSSTATPPTVTTPRIPSTPTTSGGTRATRPTRSSGPWTTSSRPRRWSTRPRPTHRRRPRSRATSFPATGLAVADLDSQQKAMVSQLLEMMLRPFRACDADEVRACLDSQRRRRQTAPHLLQGRRPRQRRRLGHLEARGPSLLVVLPRLAARPHLAQRARKA